jgi:ubiquinone/menaquinone biosynthesis C-methylase UbiE
MSQLAHTAAHERWTTPDERTATKWIHDRDRIDRTLAPFGERMLEEAALNPGEHVLDIGCGTGVTTLAVWQRVAPTGSVDGVDISPAMLEAARERVRNLPEARIRWITGDAQTYAFGPNVADVALSRFGVAHFADTTAAFKNIRRALCPDGRFVFTEWTSRAENEWMSLTDDVARQTLPQLFAHADGGHEHSCDFADEKLMRSLLETAGFQVERFERRADRLWVGSTPDDVLAWFKGLPEGRILESIDADARGKLLAALRLELERRAAPDGVYLAGVAWIVSCRA